MLELHSQRLLVRDRPAMQPLLNRSNAAAVAALAAGAIIGGITGWTVLEDTGLHAAMVEVAKGSIGAVVTLIAGYLFLQRVRRTGATVDATLAATVALLAVLTGVLAVMAAVTGAGHPASILVSAGGGIVVACGFALAAVTGERRDHDAAGSADKLLLYGICIALVVIGGIAATLGSTGIVDATGDVTGGIVALTLGAAGLYAIAAVRFGRRCLTRRDGFYVWLSVAAAASAVAGITDAAMPWTAPDLTGADIAGMAAMIALLIGGLRDFEWAHRGRAVAAVIDERKRLARELHDGLAQELAYIASHTAGGDLSEAAQRALEESRAAILQLSRPSDEPLERVITDAAQSIAVRAGIDVVVAVRPGLDAPADVRHALLRILRESMGNAIRHGRASFVRVSVDGPGPFVMVVADDGVGFDVAGPRRSDSIGLQCIRERAENLGGRMTIESRVGAGTSVAVVVP